MKAFADLYAELDATTSSNAKLAAMQHYFAEAAPEDAAWAVYFLSGGRPRQLVPVRILRELAVEISGLAPWLFEESYQAVGDLAETISLVLPEALLRSNDGLAVWVEHKLLPLRGETPQVLAERLPALWSQLPCWRLQVAGHPRLGGHGRARQQTRRPAAGGLHRPVQPPERAGLFEVDRR
jgi:DNA ligase-1